MSVWLVVLQQIEKGKLPSKDVDALIGATVGAFHAIATGKYTSFLDYLEKEAPDIIAVLLAIATIVFPEATITIEIAAVLFQMLVGLVQLAWPQRVLLGKLLVDVENDIKSHFHPWVLGSETVIYKPWINGPGPL